jgi:hypothetical protein
MTLEWPEGPEKWRQTRVAVGVSRHSNYYVKHDGKIFVFKDLKEGSKVLGLTDGKWQVVGRITYGTIFIGGPSEQSYEEWCRSPEGRAKLEADIQNFHNFRKELLALGR